jgi:putative transposase
VRQWYHNLAHLFEPEPDLHSKVEIDETNLNIEETEIYVWAGIVMETFGVIHIEVSPGRSDLDALLSVNQVLSHCRGDLLVLVVRGLWYNWPLEDV